MRPLRMGLASGSWLITLVGALAAYADPALPPLAQVIDQAIEDHAAVMFGAPQQQQLPRPIWPSESFVPWSLPRLPQDDGRSKSLNRSNALEQLASRLRASRRWGWDAQPIAYVHQAAALLDDPDPARRAVAAEFLALLPLTTVEQGLVPKVADLLDDERVAFQGITVDPQQADSAPGFESRHYEPTSMTVRETSQVALGALTLFHFDDLAQFQRWWQSDQSDGLWRWAMRWRDHPPAEDLAALMTLEPNDALKILLLASNPEAVVADAWRDFPKQQRNTRVIPYLHHPTPSIIAQFVVHHGLKNQLLAILEGPIPWPEATESQALHGLLRDTTSTLALILTRDDVVTLRTILSRSDGPTADDPRVRVRLVRLATDLAPEDAAAILVEQLERKPSLQELAADLIALTELEHLSLIKRCYQTEPHGTRDHRAGIIAAIAEHGGEAARTTLGELLAMDDLAVAEDQAQTGPLDSQSRFIAFVQAANTLTPDEPIVDQNLFDRSLIRITKGITPEMRAHNKAVPKARQQAVEQLTDFFTPS